MSSLAEVFSVCDTIAPDSFGCKRWPGLSGRKLKGHYGYYGITGNFLALAKVFQATERIWYRALARRSQRHLSWTTMQRILRRFPLPKPRIVHQHRP